MNKELQKSVVAGDLVIGDIVIPCAVLEDGTRVVSQRGVDKTLGRGKPRQKIGTDVLPSFLRPKALKPFIDKDLSAPTFLEYIPEHGGRAAIGLKAELLPRVCSVWIEAEKAGVLSETQKRTAERAYILLKGFAHVGIIALVDEATGYQKIRAEQALAKILERFIAKELQAWTKTFPIEFYAEIFRLRGWDFDELPDNKKPHTPSVIGKYTNQIIYERISPGVLDELRNRNPKLHSGHRKSKHHQWFTPEYGHPKLKEHITAVMALMRASNNWQGFMRILKKAYPKTTDQLQLEIEE